MKKQCWKKASILSLLLIQIASCHEKGVNVCSPEEARPTKRSSCTQNSLCKHETQCGCIPKQCNCGDYHCILNLHAHSHHSHAGNPEIGSSSQQHVHSDGTTHTHSDGGKPHHHMPDGAVVYEPDTHDGHDAPVDADRQAEKPRRVEKVQDTGNSTRPSDSRAHKKTQTWGMLMFLVAGAVGCLVMAGVYMVIAPLFVRCFRRRVLGKSMLSKDMFDDKEMLAMDWESKANAAGWSRDDDL